MSKRSVLRLLLVALLALALPVFALAQREFWLVNLLFRGDIDFFLEHFASTHDLLDQVLTATLGDNPFVNFSIITLGGDVAEVALVFTAILLVVTWAWQRLSLADRSDQLGCASPLIVSTLDLPPPGDRVHAETSSYSFNDS